MLWKIVEWFKRQPPIAKIVLCIVIIILLIKLFINIVLQETIAEKTNTLRRLEDDNILKHWNALNYYRDILN